MNLETKGTKAEGHKTAEMTDDRVIHIICDELKLNKEDQVLTEFIKGNHSLFHLKSDSIQFVMLIIRLEMEFGIEFDSQKFRHDGFTSFNALCDYIKEKCSNS